MVKFSQYFESIVAARPEWRKANINYHALNQLVCSVRDTNRAGGGERLKFYPGGRQPLRNLVTGVGGVMHGVEDVVHGVGGAISGVFRRPPTNSNRDGSSNTPPIQSDVSLKNKATDVTPLLEAADTNGNYTGQSYQPRESILEDEDTTVARTLLRDNIVKGGHGDEKAQATINALFASPTVDEDVSPVNSLATPSAANPRSGHTTDEDIDATEGVSQSTNRININTRPPLLPAELAEEFERLLTTEVDKATRFAMEALRKYFKYFDDNVDKWRSKKGNQKRIKSNVRYLFNELLQLVQFIETNLLCVKILVRKYVKAHTSGFMSQVLRGELPMLLRSTEPVISGLAQLLNGRDGSVEDIPCTAPILDLSPSAGNKSPMTKPHHLEDEKEADGNTNYNFGGGITNIAFTKGGPLTNYNMRRRNKEDAEGAINSTLSAPRDQSEGLPKLSASNVYDPKAHHAHSHNHYSLTAYVKAPGSENAEPLSVQELEYAEATAENVLVERLKSTLEKVENLRTIVSALWAELFTGGDITRAREHIIAGMKNTSPTQAFRVGIITALIFACVLYWLHILLELKPEESTLQRFHVAFPVVRFIFAIPCFIVMWAMNLYVFKTMKINYLYMLDLPPNNSIAWLQCLEFGLALMLVLGIGIDLYMRSLIHYKDGYYASAAGFPEVAPYVLPVVMGFIFLSLIFPWRHVMYWTRNAFAKRLWNCIRLPFVYVSFADFMVADWGTSLPQTLNDLTYTVCYFTALPSGDYNGGDSEKCYNVMSRYGYIVALIPYYWRMCQCFLMFRRTNNRVHVINLGKYTSCVLYMFFTIIQNNVDPDQSERTLNGLIWFLHIFSQLYCFAWDILMDWGWVKGKNRSSMFGSNWPYVIATIFDLFGRLFFIEVNLHLNALFTKNYAQWLQVFIELFRRGVWSIFRLENENLNNLETYRNVDFVPRVVMDDAGD